MKNHKFIIEEKRVDYQLTRIVREAIARQEAKNHFNKPIITLVVEKSYDPNDPRVNLPPKIELDDKTYAIRPPLKSQELADLESSLLGPEGQRDPIILWDDKIVDGIHRYRLLIKHGKPIKVVYYKFADDVECRLWIHKNGRQSRSLNNAERIEEVLIFENDIKMIAEMAQQHKPIKQEYIDLLPDLVKGMIKNGNINTQEILASMAKVSKGTLSNYMEVKDYCKNENDNSLIEKCLADGDDKITINAALNEARRNKNNKTKREEREERLTAAASIDYTPTFYPGDFNVESQKIHAGSIDFVLTDPPYSLNDFDENEIEKLANVTYRVLKDGRHAAIVYCNENLNLLIRKFADAGLRYERIISVDLETNATYWPSHYTVMWKPVVIFSKGTCEHHALMNDRIKDSKNEKEISEWQQSSVLFKKLIETYSVEGETVYDPMLGRAGTTLLACAETHRHSIGCEIEPEAINEIDKMVQLLNISQNKNP